MRWAVVEVKPEPHYCLFVRFKDGVAGRLQLRPEELTGALAPLRDEQFFGQVFIDYGAVAWPGEIDLAPDAMYAQIAGQRDGIERSMAHDNTAIIGGGARGWTIRPLGEHRSVYLIKRGASSNRIDQEKKSLAAITMKPRVDLRIRLAIGG